MLLNIVVHTIGWVFVTIAGLLLIGFMRVILSIPPDAKSFIDIFMHVATTAVVMVILTSIIGGIGMACIM
jgi:hypothetical protein